MNLTLAKALGGHSSFICCFPSFIYWPLCLAHPSPSTKWPLQLSWFPLSGGECLMQSLVQSLRNIAVSCSLSLSCSSLFYLDWALIHWASQMTLVVKKKKKKFTCQCRAREMGSLPGSGRSLGEENGNPLQYSCLENPMDWGAWQATVCGVTKSWTQLSAWKHTQGTLSQLGLQLSEQNCNA